MHETPLQNLASAQDRRTLHTAQSCLDSLRIRLEAHANTVEDTVRQKQVSLVLRQRQEAAVARELPTDSKQKLAPVRVLVTQPNASTRREGGRPMSAANTKAKNSHTQKTSDRSSNFSSHTTPTCLLVLWSYFCFLVVASSAGESQKLRLSQQLSPKLSVNSFEFGFKQKLTKRSHGL